MPPKKKYVPPIKPNADGTGFCKTGGNIQRRGMPAQPQSRGREAALPSTPSSRFRKTSSEKSAHGGAGSRSVDDTFTERRESKNRQNCSMPLDSGPGVDPSLGSNNMKGSSNSADNNIQSKGCGQHDGKRRGFVAPATEVSLERHSVPNNLHSLKEDAEVVSSVVLKIQYDAALLVTECRLHPASFAILGLTSGSVIKMSVDGMSSPIAYMQAFLSTSVSRGRALVSEDLSLSTCLPLNASVSITSAYEKTCLSAYVSWPSITNLLIKLRVSEQNNDIGSRQSFSSVSLSTQWRSLFRRNFQNRFVFKGMCASLRHFFHTVHVEVCEVLVAMNEEAEASEQVPFGVLTNATRIEIMGLLEDPPDDVGAPEASATAADSHSAPCTLPHFSADSHVLVVGESGTGKTYTIEELAAADRDSHRRHVFFISPEELAQGLDSEIRTATALREEFQMARLSSPATIVIDDLDTLCGGGSQGSSSSTLQSSVVGSEWAMKLFTRVLCEELRQLHDLSGGGSPPVRVLASVRSLTGLSPSLLTRTRFAPESIITLHPPADAGERYDVLLSCVRRRLSKRWGEAEATAFEAAFREVAKNAHGFNQRDLSRVIDFAMMESFKRRGTTLFEVEDLYKAAKTVRPSALGGFELSIPEVTWDDIGGSEEAKKTLRDVVEWCLGKQSWIFSQFNLTPPKGVLLYGPPGCSKTMLAKALANESRMNFISVKGPEVFSKWVGDSEKAVRDIFTRARAAAPCVVFIDELDGMCGHRGQGGVSDRVISQFLTELDGLPSSFNEKKHALVFVAATNRPDSIDTAVLRPGRIDRRVHVGLPSYAEREAIVRIQFKPLPVAPDLDLAYIAQRTEGYTGAEIVAVVNEAAFTAISNDLNAAYVSTDDVDAALRKVKPRVDPKDAEWYKNWPHSY
ncbi:unnamed protein product [Phytomonas sp. EM1]|nr:unnamed protein product [Phytomonas sp. EM1]|eukprot:CCW61587.1 unnamed protein product [Phytomonas sp. isolate EM1]